MPKSPTTPASCIEKYIREAKKSSKDETYNQYRTVLSKICRDLEDAGFNPSPQKITKEAVLHLLEDTWKEQEVSTRKWNTHILSRYLRFYGNYVIRDMDLRWPQDMRPNVDWLTDDEQYKLLTANLTPLEEMVIHLELNLGFRAAEVCNVRIENFNERLQLVEVLGKGHGDGKWRSVPYSEDTPRVLARWLEERAKIVDRVRADNPYWVDPDNLLIWCHYKKHPEANYYTDRGHSLDRSVIHKVRDRLDLSFSNHTLRRTFGRTLYHAGADIESISKILGHDDIVTTLKYLGVNMDDMKSAMSLHGHYQKNMLMRISQKGGVQTD